MDERSLGSCDRRTHGVGLGRHHPRMATPRPSRRGPARLHDGRLPVVIRVQLSSARFVTLTPSPRLLSAAKRRYALSTNRVKTGPGFCETGKQSSSPSLGRDSARARVPQNVSRVLSSARNAHGFAVAGGTPIASVLRQPIDLAGSDFVSSSPCDDDLTVYVRPRHLTEAQKAKIATELSRWKPHAVMFKVLSHDTEALQYSTLLSKLR